MKIIHGQSRTRLYQTWADMLARCDNPKCRNYRLYGARGITVCREWRGFPTFYAWAQQAGYAEGLEIDRKDSNGNYEPDNCRFVSKTIQHQNKRSVKLSVNQAKEIRQRFAQGGIQQKELAKQYGVTPPTIRRILLGYGWRNVIQAGESSNIVKHRNMGKYAKPVR